MVRRRCQPVNDRGKESCSGETTRGTGKRTIRCARLAARSGGEVSTGKRLFRTVDAPGGGSGGDAAQPNPLSLRLQRGARTSATRVPESPTARAAGGDLRRAPAALEAVGEGLRLSG